MLPAFVAFMDGIGGSGLWLWSFSSPVVASK
jgi:hypothetical protein